MLDLGSSLGFLDIEEENGFISSISFRSEPFDERAQSEVLKKAYHQLSLYFKGELKQFDLPLRPKGTDFQKKVWDELMKIPFGQTIAYKELARRLGDPKVIRAAAKANGSNPIAVVIPCHRVIGSDGSLVGYAGGLERKRELLKLESEYVQESLFE